MGGSSLQKGSNGTFKDGLADSNTVFPSKSILKSFKFFANTGNYIFKVNNRNTRTRCEICSKLTFKGTGIFIVNFEHTSHPVLVFILLTLSK